jgi:putative oxidoreductase
MQFDETPTTWSPRILSVLRIMAALLLLQYGMAKHFGFPFVAHLGNLPPFSLFWTAGLFELVGGLLLLIGLFTRCVAFVLSGLMACAYFIYHAPKGFFPIINGGDLAILFCFVFLYFAFAGGGAWSVDALRGKK